MLMPKPPLKKELEPCLEQTRNGERTVFFVDSAHFVLGAYLGYLWCFVRVIVRAPSGRQRFKVLSALNAITHELVTVTNDTYINAISVCELLDKLAALQLPTPVTLIMDNARYRHCRLVIDHAALLSLDILFLPPYSPNLNLIERLWKFVKKECLYSHYYAKFEPFKAAIANCLAQTTTKHKAALTTLLTLEFQTRLPPTSARS
jgi:transposase